MAVMQQKLKLLKGNLKRWNHNTFGNIFQDKRALEGDLEKLKIITMVEGKTTENKLKEKEIMVKLDKRCEREEIFWKQNSRVGWLKEGEKNTSFFHRSVIQHRNHNRISRLKSGNGTILETHEDIEQEIIKYYYSPLLKPCSLKL